MLRAMMLTLALSAVPAEAQVFETSAGPVEVRQIVDDLDNPWAVAFLPDEALLITERDGVLLHIAADGSRNEVGGLPEVAASGQGGLLDVVVARDFAETREIFLTFARPEGGGAQTAAAVARLSDDARTLEDVRIIFRQSPAVRGGRHFGSRIVEAPDDTLWITTGDRGQRERAQNWDEHIGKVIRVNRDGSVPADNPFAGQEPLSEIWSTGHRNAQGAALDPETGQLWTAEHGAQGGDEINQPQARKNYGWPVISYGQHYSGGQIGEGAFKPGMEQPVHYWDPSIAPSGLAIMSGNLFPEWRGDLFVGSLKFDYIARLNRQGDRISGEEPLFRDAYARIRDVRIGPDGALWFLAAGDGALYRAAPVRP